MNYYAYVGSYTFQGKSKGITIYKADIDEGKLEKIGEVSVDNCAYLIASRDHRFLYAAVDQGIAAYQIGKGGELTLLNLQSIRGMRGCHMDLHPSGRYISIGGYHDGKVTVLSVNPDGSIGAITAEFYDKGIGSVAERNFRPHISCTEFSEDGHFLFAIDSGIDQVRVFSFCEENGTLKLKDSIHSEMNSGPHRLVFSKDGKFIYMIHELKNYVATYAYSRDNKGMPRLEEIQRIGTLPDSYDVPSAACTLTLSQDGRFLICSNAGENTIAIYRIDGQGMLTRIRIMPISGDYPKDIDIFPGDRFLVSANHDSHTLTVFKADFEKGIIIMNGRAIPCDNPNCFILVSSEK